MTGRRYLRFSSVLAALVVGVWLVVPAAQSDQAPASSAPLASTIPPDPQITIGQLDNGLRYYVRANGRPENRAELRLVVNAGSVLEDDDQLGLAHFVEHMAFNGTASFPKQEIVRFMESIGMRFGPSVNAFTSFDETVYMLQVPTDRPDVLDTAFRILEDWAQHVSFDEEEIDKERGVVIEEWRLRRGATARMQDQQFPVLFAGSRYAERMPIGKVEVLRDFESDRLRQFYRDWYRPDLMAVIAVGDFDRAAVEQQIRARFAGLPPAPPDARRRPMFTVPDSPGTSYAIATDPEATGTRVTVYHRKPVDDPTTVGAYRDQIVESLFAGMLSERYAEIAQKPEAPFLSAYAQRALLVRSTEASGLGAVVAEGGIGPGLEALFVEAERVSRFGFTEAEFIRQKAELLRRLERLVAERDNQMSADLAAEYSRNYLQREPIPGIVYEHALYERFLPEITLGEVNALARTWVPDRSRVVMVNAPEKDKTTIPSEGQLASAIGAAVTADLAPYEDTTAERPLMAELPTPGRIVAESISEAVGITRWELSNGAVVVLKPTRFKQDEIVLRAFSPGGTSLASDEDFVAASTASQVIDAGGLAGFRAIELRKILTGKAASVRPTISATDEGLTGGGSPQDIETLFQLIHLTFTAPRADPEIFQVIQTQTKARLANQTATPEFAFSRALTEALTQNHFRARPMTPELVDEMDLETSMAFYRDRFADAGDFTFVFVGTIDLETLRPLVEQYLASLPTTGREESWRDVGMRPPTGIVTRRVEKGIEPRSQTAIVFTGPFDYNQEQRVAIRAMAAVLQTRLREILREDLGGTYSVGVSPNYSKVPIETYSLTISFGSSPESAEPLTARVFEEIAALRQDGPGGKYVDDTRQAMLREFETGLQQNGYLATQIVGRLQVGEDVEGFFRLDEDYYETLSAETIHEAAKRYLNPDNYVMVTLLPEN